MPAYDDVFHFADSARREIDALGAANKAKKVASIEGGVNRITGKPPVPPAAKPRPAKPAGSPFKPGQKIKGFGNAAGLEQVKRVTGEPNNPILPK